VGGVGDGGGWWWFLPLVGRQLLKFVVAGGIPRCSPRYYVERNFPLLTASLVVSQRN